MGWFGTKVINEFNRSRAQTFAGDYEGVTHAGLAIVAADTGLVLMAQRAMDETDAPDVQETWEWPGGSLDGAEEPFAAALREFSEEVVLELPEGEVVNGWRAGPEQNYQGFVYVTPTEFDLSGFVPNGETQAVAWVPARANGDMRIRPEMADFDWSLLDVSGNEEIMDDETESIEPDLSMLELMDAEVPVHGILAPEEVETGDARAFNAGSMTSRPGRLPFSWQKVAIGGHDGSIVVGSVDRLMRKDGMIHWEGSLMASEEAGEFAGLLAFFGKSGVSVDGDNGSLDTERTEATGVAWFDAVRAAGLTAVSIPAFHEAYVAFGPHPDMPGYGDDTLTASMQASGDLVTFARGPGWVTHPVETKRIHDYWTKKGQPGYAKIRWGTGGDFTRAKKLIGEKVGANSPEDLKYLNQIIARWHHDALGYWPGDWDKPGNDTTAEGRAKRAARAAAAAEHGIVAGEGTEWEMVLTSSAGVRVFPPAAYFDQSEDGGALVIEEPDAQGFCQTYGYAAEWGVCHIGYDGRCVEAPQDAKDFAEFHLGLTRTADGGSLNTGVITYKVDHRDAAAILSETPEQSHFDNIANAWAAVRLGMDDRGIWFAGVVLPGISNDDVTLIEATGQVSGEWKYGALRALQAVNVPGFPVMRSSAAYDDEGNVIALVASAHGLDGCEPTPAERMAALRSVDAEVRFETLRAKWAALPDAGA